MKTSQSLSQLTPDATIEQIVAANETAGELLRSIGLSVSKHEDETLRSVCQQQKWSESEVLSWVKKHSLNTNGDTVTQVKEPSPPEDADLAAWTSYLKKYFVSSNRSLLQELNESFLRVHKIHGNQYPWLKNVEWYFEKFREALEMYYAFEVEKFFPLCQQVSSNKARSLNHGSVQKLEKSFSIIERDQDRLNRQMSTIREKGNQFENPANACSTLRIQNENFSILFSQLEKQFDLENNHLIPGIKKELKAKR